MKSLLATALCLGCHATEETSLMQGLVARRGQLTPDAKDARKDATARLMETATKMMKNGATPDVLVFIDSTIREVQEEVLHVIVDEHHIDQNRIYELLDQFDRAVAAMEACAQSIRDQQELIDHVDGEHKICRSQESIACARSRKCEEEVKVLWGHVVREEDEMRRIHQEIYQEWCVEFYPAPYDTIPDPFHWTLSHHWEGDETSQSINGYPIVDYTPRDIEFREFSVTHFEEYILQLPRVEEAWHWYNLKLVECAALEERWQLHVTECDDMQSHLRDTHCMQVGRQCAANWGHEYEMTLRVYNLEVERIRIQEYERKREWETLHIVLCLLRTVYTHVIHSIDSGLPCPTIETHEEQTSAEINYCHVVETNFTDNLTIYYGEPPPTPPLPPPIEMPCTEDYKWHQYTFPEALLESHDEEIYAEGLEEYFTLITVFGWAGCAAPQACIPCELDELIVDPNYEDRDQCLQHHRHLSPGQMDWDTFKCLSGDECVRSEGRCNGFSNCEDGSDEVGCDTLWGVPADLHMATEDECNSPFHPELQFMCADHRTCMPIAGKCNGVANCADGSDELGCASTTQSVIVEAMSGYKITVETPEIHSFVFSDREYTFDSLGSFQGHSFIKMSNEDKHIRDTHIQARVLLPHPMTLYVAKLDDTNLQWLDDEGWSHTYLDGVSYHGVRETRHTDWSGELNEDYYGPGQVYQKTFPAGIVELRGNNGGAGSFLMFAADPAHPPVPVVARVPGADTYIGCFVDDGARDLGDMVGQRDNSATNTYELCRTACANHMYMALQWGGECFCSDEYGTASQYEQVDDSECNVVREPCSPNSHNCGGHWRQAIYRIGNSHYEFASADMKCPHNHEDRLFRLPASGSSDVSLDDCRRECYGTSTCHHFSYGAWQGGHVCMGCTSLANAQTHEGFNAYNLIIPGAFMRTYPGYEGDLHVQGTVELHYGLFDENELFLTWHLSGLDTMCTSEPGTNLGIANACGLHIHSGTSCDEASLVGGHFHDLEVDPWSRIMYMSDADGNSVYGDSWPSTAPADITTGITLAETMGRAIVVHDSHGGRIACGIIQPRPKVTATLGPYPGYTGELEFTGDVTVSEISDGGELLVSYELRGLEEDLCRRAPAGVANACGIHIHSGSTCQEHSGVGGHYYEPHLSSDPWSPVVYTPDGHGDATARDVSVRIDSGIGVHDRWTLAEVAGRAIVVHDHTGARIACGILA